MTSAEHPRGDLDRTARGVVDVRHGVDDPPWVLTAEELVRATATDLHGELATVVRAAHVLGR